MTEASKAENRSIEEWFEKINQGEITLPRFQRSEVWDKNQIKAVLENILRNPPLPIGTFLALDVPKKPLFVSRPISTAKPTKNRTSQNLLDGQQRMTAIWRSLKNNYEYFTLFVSLKCIDSVENCPKVTIFPYRKNGDKIIIPNWVKSPAECFNRKLIPVKILIPNLDGEELKDSWISEACKDYEAASKLRKWINELRRRVRLYNIPYLNLPNNINRSTAIDVFIKMNTQGTRLNELDVATALAEDFNKKSLPDMIKKLKKDVPAIDYYGNVRKIAFDVGALLSNKTPTRKTYTDLDFIADLNNNWEVVVRGIKKGTEFLQSEMILNKDIMPTGVIVYLTSALWTKVKGAQQEGHARNIIRKTIWRSCFTDRYSSSANTRVLSDYNAISDIIHNQDSDKTPALFSDERHPLPTLEALLRSPWPKERLSKAILAVSLYRGGRDFASDAPVTNENYGDRHNHHIFPKSYAIGKYDDQEVNSALNCARIDWETNLMISAKSPKEYIPKQARYFGISENMVKSRLKSHMIPYEALIKNDLTTFRHERARIIHDAMSNLANGHDIRT